MVTLSVTADDEGCRFDRFLRRRLPHTALAEVFRLIRTKRARINGRRARENSRLREGDAVELRVDPAEVSQTPGAAGAHPSDLVRTSFFRRNFRAVFEDDALLACDKPTGLVVHPGSGHTKRDTLIDLVRAYLASSGLPDAEPSPVHRIDRDTSGLILIAKRRGALRKLNAAMRAHHFDKRYVLVCHGRPRPARGTIEVGLARTYERNDGTKMRVADDGQESVSRYRVVRGGKRTSLVEVSLETGRTHQIRVHMKHLGCPVVGDVRYGDAELDSQLFADTGAVPRLFLHAGVLTFPHPLSEERITLEAPPPPAFGRLAGLGGAVPRRRRR